VVIEVPASVEGRITVVTRTSQPVKKGIPHDPMPEIGLRKPGVFANLGSAPAVLWTPRNVQHLGRLPEDVLSRVIERFG